MFLRDLLDKNKMALYQQTSDIINNGLIYICGRDNQERPVIYADLAKIQRYQPQTNDMLNAVIYVTTIAKTFMFHPGKIESFFVVVDAQNVNSLDRIQVL